MKTKCTNALIILVFALTLAALSAQAQENLVANGSFQDAGGSFNYWNLNQIVPESPAIEIGTIPYIFALFQEWGGSISQNISTTPGAMYSLSFSAIQFDGTNRSSISINGGLLAYINFTNCTFISPTNQNDPSYQINTNWENFSFSFYATSASTSIMFSELSSVFYNVYEDTYYSSHGGLASIGVFIVPGSAAVAWLSNPVLNPNGSVTFQALSAPGSTNIIQAATGLIAPVVWQNLGTNIADTNGIWLFTDTAATNHSACYYRTVAP